MDSSLQARVFNKQVGYAKKGMAAAIAAGALWGLNGVLLGFVFHFDPFLTVVSVLVASIVQAGLHDGFAAIWVILYNLKNGKIKEYARTLSTRPGKIICIGGICGGPLAMTGYVLGINLAGAAYAMPISALCPCVGAFLAAVFLKERIQPRVWVGIILAVAGVIIVSYVPPEGADPANFYLGIALATLATLGWGIEGALGSYGLDLVDPNLATGVKYLSSFVVYIVVVIPLCGGLPFLFQAVMSMNAMALLAIAAITGADCYIFWYKALNMTGVSRTMALNDTYVLWGLVFTALFSAVGLMEFSFTPNLVIGALIVVVGVILVVAKPSDLITVRNN